MARITCMVALACGFLSAQSYVLKAVVLDGGGNKPSSSSYRCGLSIGQQVASEVIESSGYRAVLGFWHNPYGGGLPGVEEAVEQQMQLNRFGLSQNFPNPFSGVTRIRYSLGKEADAVLSVYDATGRAVRTLVRETQKPGAYLVTWDVRGVTQDQLPRGTYFCRLVAGDFRATRKMVKLE